MIDAILMRSLPVQDAQSLVVLQWSARKRIDIHSSSSYGDCNQQRQRNGPNSSCSFSEPFFHDVAAQVKAFSSVAAFAYGGQLDLSGNGTASVLSAQAVSGEFFPTLGIRAETGCAARFYARPHIKRFVRHSRRSAECHGGTNEDVSHTARFPFQGGRYG